MSSRRAWPRRYTARRRSRFVWPAAGVLAELYDEALESGRYRDALLNARGMADLGIARGWYLEARVLDQLGWNRSADWATRRAASAGDPDGLRRWALLKRRQGKLRPALRALRRAALLKPDPEWAALELDWRYWAGDMNVTADDLSAAAREYPPAAKTRAHLLKDLGMISEAELEFEAAAKEGQWEAWVPLGNIARDNGDSTLALERYQRAVDEGDSYAMFNMALTLSELGRDAEAERMLRQAAREDRWARRDLSSTRRQRVRRLRSK